MADPLTAGDVDRTLALLRGGASNADLRSSTTLIADLREKLAAAGHAELAATLDRLAGALDDGAGGGAIGGHMSRLGEQVEALATRAPGPAAALRELAERLTGEGARLAARD